MKECEKLLTENLIERRDNYYWRGWVRRHSGAFNENKPRGTNIVTVGIKTISPTSLNKISIRLRFAAEYTDERNFDPSVHNYYRYEFRIEDELSRKQINICTIIVKNGDPDISALEKLFSSLAEIAVFDDVKRIEMQPSEKELLAAI